MLLPLPRDTAGPWSHVWLPAGHGSAFMAGNLFKRNFTWSCKNWSQELVWLGTNSSLLCLFSANEISRNVRLWFTGHASHAKKKLKQRLTKMQADDHIIRSLGSFSKQIHRKQVFIEVYATSLASWSRQRKLLPSFENERILLTFQSRGYVFPRIIIKNTCSKTQTIYGCVQ